MSQTKIKHVAIYVRHSREDKSGTKMAEGQLEVLERIAREFNWTFEKFIESGDASSQSLERPELQNLLRKVENLQFTQYYVPNSHVFHVIQNILQKSKTFLSRQEHTL